MPLCFRASRWGERGAGGGRGGATSDANGPPPTPPSPPSQDATAPDDAPLVPTATAVVGSDGAPVAAVAVADARGAALVAAAAGDALWLLSARRHLAFTFGVGGGAGGRGCLDVVATARSPLAPSPLAALALSRDGAAIVVAADDGRVACVGVGGEGVGEGGALTTLWVAAAPAPAALLAAGDAAAAPAATAAAGGKTVTVWWPPVAAAAAAAPAAADALAGLGDETRRLLGGLAAPAPGPPAAAAPALDACPTLPAATAEPLRHPAPVLALAWAPPPPRAGAPTRDPRRALATLAADGGARVWVEVEVGAPAAGGGTRYCAALLLHPPAPSPPPSSLAWADPLPGADGRWPPGAAEDVLWLTVAGWGGGVGGEGGGGGGGDGAAASTSSSLSSATLALWAVDGLDTIIVPRPGAGGSRPSLGPRGALWGRARGARLPTPPARLAASVVLDGGPPSVRVAAAAGADVAWARLDAAEGDVALPPLRLAPGGAARAPPPPRELPPHDGGRAVVGLVEEGAGGAVEAAPAPGAASPPPPPSWHPARVRALLAAGRPAAAAAAITGNDEAAADGGLVAWAAAGGGGLRAAARAPPAAAAPSAVDTGMLDMGAFGLAPPPPPPPAPAAQVASGEFDFSAFGLAPPPPPPPATPAPEALPAAAPTIAHPALTPAPGAAPAAFAPVSAAALDSALARAPSSSAELASLARILSGDGAGAPGLDGAARACAAAAAVAAEAGDACGGAAPPPLNAAAEAALRLARTGTRLGPAAVEGVDATDGAATTTATALGADPVAAFWGCLSATPASLAMVLLATTPRHDPPPPGPGGRPPSTGCAPEPWAPLRAAGAGFWLARDPAAAAKVAEALAKAQFGVRKDPADAALMYVCAGRARPLAALLRAGGDPKLADFFGREYGGEEAKRVAVKNAYAAIASRRFALAAAAFALAGAPADAVGVCAREGGDPQLGLLVGALLGVQGGEAVRAAAADAAASRSAWPAAALRVATGDADGAIEALAWWRGGPGGGALLPALRALAAPAALLAPLAPLVASALADGPAPDLAAEAIQVWAAVGGGAPEKGLVDRVAAAGGARGAFALVASAAERAAADRRAAEAELTAEADAAAADAGERLASLRARLRPALAARRAAAPSPPPPPARAPFDDAPTILARLPGDRLHALAAARGGRVDAPRALAAAAAGAGVVWVDWPRDDDRETACTDVGTPRRGDGGGFAFKAALGEALDSYDAAPTPPSLSPPLSDPSPPPARIAAMASGVAGCVCLGAHPFRPLVLAGAPTGELLLFQFGRASALAAYTPLTPGDGAGGDGGEESLFAAPAAAWHAAAPDAAAASWGVPQAARFSRCGERAAALGSLGGLALWSLDAPRAAASGTGALGRAAWSARGLAGRGAALAWIGSSSSLVAVGGSDPDAMVQLWDSRRPPAAGAAARAAPGGGPLVVGLASLPGGRALAVADEAGGLHAVDLRALGGSGSARAELWRAPRADARAAAACLEAGAMGPHSLVVAGGRDGRVRVYEGGGGRLLQTLRCDGGGPAPRRPSPDSPRPASWLAALIGGAPRAAPSPAVTGLALTRDGLAACALDGVARAWRPAAAATP